MSPVEPARLRAPLDAANGRFDLFLPAEQRLVENIGLAALADQLDRRPFEVVVPALAGHVALLRIPTNNISMARRAAPFALEEHLLSPPDAVRIAVVPACEPGAWVTFAVGRDWLLTLEGRLAAVGLRPWGLRPDWIRLAIEEGEWSLLLDGPLSLLRHGRWRVTCADTDSVAPLLATLLDEAGDTRPRALRIWAEPTADAALAPLMTLLAGHGISCARAVPPSPAARRLLTFLGGPGTNAHGIESALVLAPQPHEPTGLLGRFGLPGMTPAATRRVALLALVAGLATTGVMQGRRELQTQLADAQSAIDAIARQALPPGTRLVDAEAQLRQALAVSGGPPDGLAELLLLAAPVLAALPSADLELRALDYLAGDLTLELLAPSVLAADALVQRLAALPGARAELLLLDAATQPVAARVRFTRTRP